MRKPRYHFLKRPKFRATWNKHNLYNLSRVRRPSQLSSTYFQQKWAAKSATRAYHGEQIREGQWEQMFNRRMPAVQEMDARYLAQNDGAEQAVGRGLGLEGKLELERAKTNITPYMQMVYYPMERRLDTAVFRALFASSARQARQFVIHGSVKVNGKKMIYPGYLLNPGDMFQVDPERVLYATGARKDQHRYGPKPPKQHPALQTSNRRTASRAKQADIQAREAEAEEALTHGLNEAELEPSEAAADGASPQDVNAAAQEPPDAGAEEITSSLNDTTLQDPPSQPSTSSTSAPPSSSSTTSPTSASDALYPDELEEDDDDLPLSPSDQLLASTPNRPRLPWHELLALQQSKPYRLPWRPRDYMSAFAFIPRYLEVNQKVCSAVYLRHPVARPGLGEVPGPFGAETSQLVYNWYLRRR